jgi:fluoroacetyl-CoA thioesterase
MSDDNEDGVGGAGAPAEIHGCAYVHACDTILDLVHPLIAHEDVGMARTDVKPLDEATVSMVVGPGDLASEVGAITGDAFPEVFATARMIGLMELAAGRCLALLCEAGELSVGVVVDVRHTAPTPPGATVTATARYLGTEGKLYRFEVTASDPAGEIGRGTHQRAIIETARLLDGAARRSGG